MTHHLFLQISTNFFIFSSSFHSYIFTLVWFSSYGLAFLVICRSSNAQAPLFVWLFTLRPAIKRSFCSLQFDLMALWPKGLAQRNIILSDSSRTCFYNFTLFGGPGALERETSANYRSIVSVFTSVEVSSKLRPTHAGEGGIKRHLCHVQPYSQIISWTKWLFSQGQQRVLLFTGCSLSLS